MNYAEKNQENIQFLSIFIICLLLHMVLILLLPSFYSYMPNIKESKEEKIRAGLVSFIKVEEKKLANTPSPEKKLEEKVKQESAKKVEISKPKVETKVKKVEVPKPVEKKVEEVKAVVEEKTRPLLQGPSREERRLDTTQVLRTNVNNSNLRDSHTTNNTNIINLHNERELKASTNTQIANTNRELIDSNSNINIGLQEKIEIGTDIAKVNMDFNNNLENTIDIKGKDIKTQLPSNMSARSLDIEGGRVDFINYKIPTYPQEALARAQSGSVEAEFEIRGNNTIFIGITTKSGFPSIDRAVEEAAREWRLRIEKDGLLVNGRVSVRVDFGLKARN